MTNETAISELMQYARSNYEEGGHWVFECFDVGDYEEVLERCRGNMDEAKLMLRERWTLMVEREREYAFGDGEY